MTARRAIRQDPANGAVIDIVVVPDSHRITARNVDKDNRLLPSGDSVAVDERTHALWAAYRDVAPLAKQGRHLTIPELQAFLFALGHAPESPTPLARGAGQARAAGREDALIELRVALQGLGLVADGGTVGAILQAALAGPQACALALRAADPAALCAELERRVAEAGAGLALAEEAAARVATLTEENAALRAKAERFDALRRMLGND